MPKRGFTLIELLVVIAIIGVLAAMLIFSLSGARAKARDVTRKSDLRQIATKLDEYYNDQKPEQYIPGSGLGATNGVSLDSSSADTVSPKLVPNYLAKMPTDPKYKLTNPGNFVYKYASPVDGSSYELYATLENQNDPDGNTGNPWGFKIASN